MKLTNTFLVTVCAVWAANLSSAAAAYKVINRYNDLALDVSGLSQSDGAQVWEWQYLGQANQQWNFAKQSDGSYTLTNVNSGKCLDVRGGSNDNGAGIQQWGCWGGANQRWRLLDQGNGAYQLQSVQSGKCLDSPQGQSSNGLPLQQWDCWTGVNQQWTITSLDAGGGTSGGTSGGTTGGGAGGTTGGGGGTTTGGGTSTVPGLHVSGTQLIDETGRAVRLHGVNVSSLEWGTGEPATYGSPAPCWAGQTIVDSVNKALNDWQVNLIRLPINPDRWWNAVDNQGLQYRALIDNLVNTVTQKGAYIIVDIHWSDMGQWGQNNTQHFMPDDNTQTVLRDVAAHYKGNQRVLIGVYNEPHDVSWDVWRNGGWVNENGVSYHTPGMQAMVDTVRQAGANNIVVVAGLEWSFDQRGQRNGYTINDNNMLLDSHIYAFKGHHDQWDNEITVASDKFPILIGEFGADWRSDTLGPFSNPVDFLNELHGWLDAHNYHYAAWNLHPTSWPALIKDWCYQPTEPFGTTVIPWLK